MKRAVITSFVILMAGYLLYQIGAGELLGGAGNVLAGDPCKKAQPLTAPTLAELYTFSEGLAKGWKADAVLVSLNHGVAPLQPNGSSTNWSVGFYSAAAKVGMQIHTGDGKLYCRMNRGESDDSHFPALRPDFTRDGAALYALAEKHGHVLLEKGYLVSINLWATGDHHAMWHVSYAKPDGSDSGMRLVVDTNTGALEEIVKN